MPGPRRSPRLPACICLSPRPVGAEALKPHFDFATNLNLKAVNHIDGRPAIRQLTSRRLAEVTVHEA